MTSSHPFFNVDYILNSASTPLHVFRYFLVWIWFFCSFKVTSEMLQQSYFFLQIFWIISQCVLFTNILSVSISSFHIVEVETIRIQTDLRWVIEEDSSCFIAQAITKTIFRRVINPFFYPDLVIFWLSLETLGWCLIRPEVVLCRCWILCLSTSTV